MNARFKHRILDAVEDEFPVDPDRRYVAGLSSGAAMGVMMAVAYSEDIAAAGAVAGLPYREDACAVANACFTGIAHKPVGAFVEAMQAEQQSAEEQRLVPVMAIHSTNDMIVPIRNAENIRDSWIAHYGADATPAATEDCTAEGVACEHASLTDQEGRTVVETVFYNDRGCNSMSRGGGPTRPSERPFPLRRITVKISIDKDARTAARAGLTRKSSATGGAK